MMVKLKLSEAKDTLLSIQERLASTEERLGKLETLVYQAIRRSGHNDELMNTIQ